MDWGSGNESARHRDGFGRKSRAAVSHHSGNIGARRRGQINRVARAEIRSSGEGIDPEFLPKVVPYPSQEKPGTIIIDTESRHLYLIMPDQQALRYGVGVGRPGFEWAGEHHITRMAEWPDWTPPAFEDSAYEDEA